jgi:hypothetical protein
LCLTGDFVTQSASLDYYNSLFLISVLLKNPKTEKSQKTKKTAKIYWRYIIVQRERRFYYIQVEGEMERDMMIRWQNYEYYECTYTSEVSEDERQLAVARGVGVVVTFCSL